MPIHEHAPPLTRTNQRIQSWQIRCDMCECCGWYVDHIQAQMLQRFTLACEQFETTCRGEGGTTTTGGGNGHDHMMTSRGQMT